jgi:hypothetical protein
MRRQLLIVAVVMALLSPAAFSQKGGRSSCRKSLNLRKVNSAFSKKTGKYACDYACLKNYVDQYMDAMLAHDPERDLFAKNIKFSENGMNFSFGHEGLWLSMSGKGANKFFIPDIEAQQIAFIGTVREEMAAAAAKTAQGAKSVEPIIAAIVLRLKIENKLITEVEQLVIRPETNLAGMENNATFPPAGMSIERIAVPDKIFTEVIPEDERLSREDLIDTANLYFTGLQSNDTEGDCAFTNDCQFQENGIVSNRECKKQFESRQLPNNVSRIRDCRFVAVDREHGVVFAFGFLDHEQNKKTWQIAEMLKIDKCNIRRIEAVSYQCPYGRISGWSADKEGILEGAQNIQ